MLGSATSVCLEGAYAHYQGLGVYLFAPSAPPPPRSPKQKAPALPAPWLHVLTCHMSLVTAAINSAATNPEAFHLHTSLGF